MFGISNHSKGFVVNSWESFWSSGVWDSLSWEIGLPGVSSAVFNCGFQAHFFFLFSEKNSATCSMHTTSFNPYSKHALGIIPFYWWWTQGYDQFSSLLKISQTVDAATIVPRDCRAQRLGSSQLWAFAICKVLCAHDSIEEANVSSFA